MRTALAVELTQVNNIPRLRGHAHDLPSFPEILCIDFFNDGNKALPQTFQNIMLVPDDVTAPNLGKDRTMYTVPADYHSVEMLTSLGNVGDQHFVVAQLTIHIDSGEPVRHTHVLCPIA